MPLAYITHPDCALHETGPGHPENPARLDCIHDRLLAGGLEAVLHHHTAPTASREQLCRVHDPDYVDYIFSHAPDEGFLWLDQDTCMSPHTLAAARHAAGAVVHGVELVVSGRAGSAFCAVRPPGHHAERCKATGFCIFNNIAVGAAHALQACGVRRVAIVDFDAHHGNGTEDIFRDTPEVLLCSTFQHPFYPDTGSETVSDHIANSPLPAGSNGRALRAAVESAWLPALDAFRPDLLMISAGFDGHIEDSMTGLCLTERDFLWVTRRLREVAQHYAQGRVVSVLEGGYALPALGRCVAAHLDALL
jgi:acetoin utilization deacetylase AcuC-like enzyme